MNLFKHLIIGITALSAANSPAVCDVFSDLELQPSGDQFWDWIFGGDSTQSE